MLSTVFNNQQRSGYEELFSYGPYFYKDLLEMDVNYRFAGDTLDLMAEKLELLMQDQFIDSMDEQSIERLEKWLHIVTDRTKNLEDRRKKVKLFWNGGDKLSGRLIKSMVMSYTGCEDTPSVRMTNRLSIMAQIKDENTVFISDLVEQIERMKPAHILVDIMLVSTTKIKFRTYINHYVYPFDLCGEKPDISTWGSYLQTHISVRPKGKGTVYPFEEASEYMQAGTHPQITTPGVAFSSVMNISTGVSDSVYEHNPSSEEQETGVYPVITTVGQYSSDGVTVSTEEKASIVTFEECGTNPNIATLGQQSNEGVSIGTVESSAVLSFVECGTNQCGEEVL